MAKAQMMIPDLPMTPFKNVNIICKSEAATIAVSELDKTYWQTEGNDVSGMQFKVVSWLQGKCFHCFEAVGEYRMGKDVLRTVVTTSYDLFKKKMSMTYSLLDSSGKTKPVILPQDFQCVVK